ncbi:hypothetical protein FGG08_003881 [Glutinoglossum americanum]|uniref:Uncharacterized protein n=1 Tax=Glutinoglossum americanum TaxID=1670608 RepID=A0A9P8I8P1_9PEZI|nr:hypothetical protein FGG08_003881 [Glutinoglossum americanum]
MPEAQTHKQSGPPSKPIKPKPDTDVHMAETASQLTFSLPVRPVRSPEPRTHGLPSKPTVADPNANVLLTDPIPWTAPSLPVGPRKPPTRQRRTSRVVAELAAKHKRGVSEPLVSETRRWTSTTAYHITETVSDPKTERDTVYYVACYTSLDAANLAAHKTFLEDLYLEKNMDKLLSYEVSLKKNVQGERELNAVARFDGWRVKVAVMRVDVYDTGSSGPVEVSSDEAKGTFMKNLSRRYRHSASFQLPPKSSPHYEKVLAALAGLAVGGVEETEQPGEKRKRLE